MDNNDKNINSTEIKETKQGTSPLLRVTALIGVIAIIGLFVLAFIASLSDWENSFGITMGAISALIFVPIIIYLIKLFTGRN